MELLEELGALRVDDTCARNERDLGIDCQLERMVDDFMSEWERYTEYCQQE